MESLKQLQNGTSHTFSNSSTSSSSSSSTEHKSPSISDVLISRSASDDDNKSPYDPPPTSVSYDSRDFLTVSQQHQNGITINNKPPSHGNSNSNSRPGSPAVGAMQNDHHLQGEIALSRQRSGNVFRVSNKYVQRNHLEQRHADHLYHLNMILEPSDRASLRRKFGDVKVKADAARLAGMCFYSEIGQESLYLFIPPCTQFVITGGTPSRMQSFARLCLDRLNIAVPAGLTLCDLCGPHARYVMYKAGPVLAVNHGMGIPSLSIMLHEVFKLLHYAEATSDVVFFRLGTCGGVGIPGGTVVVSNKIYDGLFQTSHQQLILGKRVLRPAILDERLNDELVTFAGQQQYPFPVCSGSTMCTDDFYEGQARLDGAICSYTSEEKLAFLRQCYEVGVRNIEMESLAFAAYTHQLGVKAAVVCIALLDRLHADQISADKAGLLAEWEERPRKLIVDYIASRILRGGSNQRHSPTRQQNCTTNGSTATWSDTDNMHPNVRRSRSLAILALSPEAERVSGNSDARREAQQSLLLKTTPDTQIEVVEYGRTTLNSMRMRQPCRSAISINGRSC